MAYYEIFGKWYHLSYSDYFKHVVRARTPGAALIEFACGLEGVEDPDDIYWEFIPSRVKVGLFDQKPTFWVGDDQMYQVRMITRVKPAEIECPTCKGVGKIMGHVETDKA